MQLLVADWLGQIDAEQKRRSADLLAAVLGSDSRTVDERLMACDQLDEVRKLAVLLADRLTRLQGAA